MDTNEQNLHFNKNSLTDLTRIKAEVIYPLATVKKRMPCYKVSLGFLQTRSKLVKGSVKSIYRVPSFSNKK